MRRFGGVWRGLGDEHAGRSGLLQSEILSIYSKAKTVAGAAAFRAGTTGVWSPAMHGQRSSSPA